MVVSWGCAQFVVFYLTLLMAVAQFLHVAYEKRVQLRPLKQTVIIQQPGSGLSRGSGPKHGGLRPEQPDVANVTGIAAAGTTVRPTTVRPTTVPPTTVTPMSRAPFAAYNFTKQQQSSQKLRQRKALGFCTGDGLLLLEQEKVAVCLLPKVATTTWKFIALRLLGNHPQAICGCKNEEWGCLRSAINDHRRPQWRGGTWASQLQEEELKQTMQNSSWLSIAMLREPWKRTVSGFWEDHHSKVNPSDFLNASKEQACRLQGLFLDFVKRTASADSCHSLPMTAFCHFSEVEFQHVLDLGDGFRTLEPILGGQPLMVNGWESCMRTGSPSFFDGRLSSPHHGVGTNKLWAELLCTTEIFKLVELKYAYDFAIYRKYFPDRPSGCRPRASAC